MIADLKIECRLASLMWKDGDKKKKNPASAVVPEACVKTTFLKPSLVSVISTDPAISTASSIMKMSTESETNSCCDSAKTLSCWCPWIGARSRKRVHSAGIAAEDIPYFDAKSFAVAALLFTAAAAVWKLLCFFIDRRNSCDCNCCTFLVFSPAFCSDLLPGISSHSQRAFLLRSLLEIITANHADIVLCVDTAGQSIVSLMGHILSGA